MASIITEGGGGLFKIHIQDREFSNLVNFALSGIGEIAADVLNRIAYKAQGNVKTVIKAVFEGAIPYTINSVGVWRATPENQRSHVFIYGSNGYEKTGRGKGNSQVKWLLLQETGGVRTQKKFEKALGHAVQFVAPGVQVIPATDERDGAGNMTGQKLQQMLSALQAHPFDANSKKRSKVGKYMLWQKYADSPAKGVLVNDGSGRFKPFLIFTKPQRYKARFPFQQTVQQTYDDNIDRYYSDAWLKVMS